jgi:hypothetical protein
MSQRDWKFHDYGLLFLGFVRVNREKHKVDFIYALSDLPVGYYCTVFKVNDVVWIRKTRKDNSNSTIRYARYFNEDDALRAGVDWARRQDEIIARKSREQEAA